MGRILLLIIIAAIVAVQYQNSEETKGGMENNTVVPISNQQKDFIKIIHSFKDNYSKAPNDIKRTEFRKQRKTKLAELFRRDLSVQFVGKITSISTTSNQDAKISIILLGTHSITLTNDDFSNVIKSGTSLYNTVADIELENNIVKFKGSFFSDKDGLDHMEENSSTEFGAMRDPEFLFEFQSIEKIG